jgi:hypothetical protein
LKPKIINLPKKHLLRLFRKHPEGWKGESERTWKRMQIRLGRIKANERQLRDLQNADTPNDNNTADLPT